MGGRLRRAGQHGATGGSRHCPACGSSRPAMFEKLTGANRYAILYRIGNAKRPETRSRRIDQFVEMLARGETVHPQAP